MHFAHNKLNIAKMMIISLYDRLQNIVGNRENAGYQHFLLFPQCFPKPSSLGSLKVGIMWERVKLYCEVNLSLYHTNLTFNDREKEAF